MYLRCTEGRPNHMIVVRPKYIIPVCVFQCMSELVTASNMSVYYHIHACIMQL